MTFEQLRRKDFHLAQCLASDVGGRVAIAGDHEPRNVDAPNRMWRIA
jgi:hypothetical protein